jgi:hypothetical protein
VGPDVDSVDLILRPPGGRRTAGGYELTPSAEGGGRSACGGGRPPSVHARRFGEREERGSGCPAVRGVCKERPGGRTPYSSGGLAGCEVQAPSRCLACAKGFAGLPHDTPRFLGPPQRSAPVFPLFTPGPESAHPHPLRRTGPLPRYTPLRREVNRMGGVNLAVQCRPVITPSTCVSASTSLVSGRGGRLN